MKVMDVVTINDIEGTPGIIESVKTFRDGMTIYSVRSPYTGILYSREADEITPATDETRDMVLRDMRHMEPVAGCEIVKDYGNAIMTQGMVDAEVRATQTIEPAARVAMLGDRQPGECRCTYLGSMTPAHAPSPLCRSTAPYWTARIAVA